MIDKISINNCTGGSYVADVIRTEILKGHIKDGTELNQTNLAETLNVSRMPVRDALSQLEKEGYIKRLNNRHAVVVGMSLKEVEARLKFLESILIEALLSFEKDDEIEQLSISERHYDFHSYLFSHSPVQFYGIIFKTFFSNFLFFIFENIEKMVLAGDLIRIVNCSDRQELISLADEYYGKIMTEVVKRNESKS